jgi:purine-binding chemotaxis protein CheW
VSDRHATWLEVSVAGFRYAIAAEAVRSVERPGLVDPLPMAPAFVAGTTASGDGRAVVIDLRVRLGLRRTPLSESTRIVFLEGGGRSLGFLVDAALGVLHAPVSSLHAVPAGPFRQACLRGVLTLDGSWVLVLDPTVVASLGGIPCPE